MKKIYLLWVLCAYIFAGCGGGATKSEEHNHDHEAHEHEGSVQVQCIGHQKRHSILLLFPDTKLRQKGRLYFYPLIYYSKLLPPCIL